MALRLLNSSCTVKQALEVLNLSNVSLVAVVDDINTVLGTITDGDIRRFLLSDKSLNDTCTSAMNSNFKYILKGESSSHAKCIAKEESISEILVLEPNKQFYSSISLYDVTYDNNSNVPVVIMAGGRGSRLMPLTKDVPKPMIDVSGQPMLLRQINLLKDYGFSKIYISVNYLKDYIMDYFGDGSHFGVEIDYLIEQKPLGTAGSLSLIDDSLKYKNYLVMNADILHDVDLSSLIRYHLEENVSATVAANTLKTQMQFGVLNISDSRLISIEEKPIYSHLVNAGIYVINSHIINSLSPDEHIDMTTMLENIIEVGESVSVFPIHEDWIDVGIHTTLQQARDRYQ